MVTAIYQREKESANYIRCLCRNFIINRAATQIAGIPSQQSCINGAPPHIKLHIDGTGSPSMGLPVFTSII